MSHKLLFLIGGSAAYDAVAEAFVPAAGGGDAKIAVLLQGGAGWEKHRSEYVEPWIQRGVSRYDPIAPDERGVLDVEAASALLCAATGIFIGGGHTPTYHRLYATEPMRSVIRERYRDGVPIAGVSAGALIALGKCVLTTDETGDHSLKVVAGLDLVRDIIVGVHFTERNDLSNVLEAMAQTRTKIAWGLDDPACAVFENAQFKGALGQSVYEIVMSDFEAKTYRITEHIELYHGS
jgi:cyanophycinase